MEMARQSVVESNEIQFRTGVVTSKCTLLNVPNVSNAIQFSK